MPTKRRYRSSRRGSAQQVAWFNTQTIPATLVAGQIGFTDVTPISAIPDGYGGGFTVVRMLLSLMIRPISLDSTTTWGLGIATATRDAFLAGQGPDPAVDLVDWYYLKLGTMFRDTDSNMEEHQADIRTARKIRGQDRTLAAYLQNTSALTLSYSLFTRVLLKRS